MAKDDSFYPAAPPGIPDDLTSASGAYKMQVLMVLLALGMFFVLYFGLMFFCLLYFAWVVFFCFYKSTDGRDGAIWLIAKLISILLLLPAFLLFIYMAKNLLKFQRAQKIEQIEIFEDEHPRLFDFIHQVCDDVGAKYPEHVYIKYGLEAAAVLDSSSIFNLILPARKSLVIGFALLNTINLTEFKALLAHEFGHFSQKSMRLLLYINQVMRIVLQVVYGEDMFDRFIIAWSKWDPRIAWPAYMVRAVVWCMRKILEMLFFVVFYFHKALSRQEEFNADLVAVSLTGSDAPVHLLARCYIGDASWRQAISDLKVCLDNHIYTADLYYHQSAALYALRKKNKDNKFNVDDPPPLPDDPDETTQVFEEDDDRLSDMWRDHPSNYDREQNCKATYIRTDFDERSPWLLFDNLEELRERVSYKFYRYYFNIDKEVILADPLEVQGFIDEEHGDRAYDPKYQGLYDNRNLYLKGIQDMAKEGSKQPWSITELGQTHATLYNAEVKHRSQLYYKRFDEFNLMTAVINGWHKPKDDELEFRGETYEPDDAKRLLKKVEKELEQDHKWIAALDRKVFMTYFQMALHINRAVAEELYRRYDFHLELQNIWFALQQENRPMQNAMDFLNSLKTTQVQSHHFQELIKIFREAHKTMRNMLKAAKDITMPALKNLPAGQSLQPFLLSGELIEGLSKYERSLSDRWIQGLLYQFRDMKGRVDRIHFKSMAGILALQEKIGNECARRWASLPAVKAAAAK
jgi:Zn-dependent protease with chaperone function